MSDVVRRKHNFWRPIRLEQWMRSAIAMFQMVVIRIDEVRFGIPIEQANHFKKSEWRQGIVVVEKDDELTGCQVERGVGVPGNSAVGYLAVMDPAILAGKTG